LPTGAKHGRQFPFLHKPHVLVFAGLLNKFHTPKFCAILAQTPQEIVWPTLYLKYHAPLARFLLPDDNWQIRHNPEDVLLVVVTHIGDANDRLKAQRN
jgi:hypothetical protein